MTTLLHQGGRRCSATCHDATGPACHCVCGGVLHGAGEEALSRLEASEVPSGVQITAIQRPIFPKEIVDLPLQAASQMPTM